MSEKKERIILDVAYQPQVRTKTDTRRLMLRVILALLPAAVWSVIQFGGKTLVVMASSVLSAVFFEWAYRKLVKKSASIGDLSAVVTGLLLALTLPPSSPWWLPVIGTFFAIVVVKQLYGGIGKNFLNPALAARAFLLASYAMLLGRFPAPAAMQGIQGVDAISAATPMSFLYGGEPLPAYYNVKTMFLGQIPGAIGEISTLLLLIGGLFLICTKVISWRIPVSYLGTVAVLTFAFGGKGYSHFDFMVYNLLSGGLVLAAFFMATDYATSPVTLKGQLLYGFGCGAITVLIRYFGGYPEGATYAILLMNLCAWAIDKGFHRHQFGVSKEDVAAEKAAKKAEKLAAKEAAK